MKIVSKSVLDTEKIAGEFIKKISTAIYDRALVVGLYGDLGSGKTTFTQSIAKIFDVTEDVTSPTYVIEKIYNIGHGNFKKLIHIDAYRLEREDELEKLGFRELLDDPKNLILLEWPERVAGLVPEDSIKIRFDIHGDERTISVNGVAEESSER